VCERNLSVEHQKLLSTEGLRVRPVRQELDDKKMSKHTPHHGSHHDKAEDVWKPEHGHQGHHHHGHHAGKTELVPGDEQDRKADVGITAGEQAQMQSDKGDIVYANNPLKAEAMGDMARDNMAAGKTTYGAAPLGKSTGPAGMP
jgi:hypothetical protein